MKLSKTIVAPIVTVLVLFIESVFHLTISHSLQDEFVDIIVNGSLLVTALAGIIENHKIDVKSVKGVEETIVKPVEKVVEIVNKDLESYK